MFGRNPGGAAINGSLWTLFYEVACYAVVVACGAVGLLRRPAAFAVVAAAIAIAFAVPQREQGGSLALTAMLFLPFALGGAAYVYRAHLPLSAWIAAALVAITAAIGPSSLLYPMCRALALCYVALWFGFSLPRLGGYARLGDYSYGVYIYAFPIEQLVVWLLPGCSPGTVIVLSLPATLALAVLSWRIVEAPALAHRHLVRRRWWRSVAAS